MRSLFLALVALGSAGDVHPLLALGRCLRARGHRIVMLTNPVFAPVVARAGLAFLPLGTAQQYEDTVCHPRLWHPVDGLGVLWRYLLRPALGPTCRQLLDLRGQGLDAVLAAPLAMGARLAQEAGSLRLLSIYTAPAILRTSDDPMSVAQWRMPRWMPIPARRTLWRMLDAVKLEPLVQPALRPLRSALGLAPGTPSTFGDWMHSPDGGLALFPAWFAPRASDWPAALSLADFPLFDDDTVDGLPGSLQRFLDSGPAPLVVMPGSARRDAQALVEAARLACRQLGLRAVLLGPAAGPPASEREWCGQYASFSPLLARARAVVHHGGIGSCAQALAAGLPQLALPSAFDQFDNGWRIERLNAGRSLAFGRATPGRLADTLQALLGDAAVDRACQALARRLDAPRARQLACERVEGWAT